MTTLLRDTAFILTGTPEVDADTGEDTGQVDWTTPDSVSVRCSIQPRDSREDTEGGSEVVVGKWFGYFPAGTVIGHGDRVSWHGKTFAVDSVNPWYKRDVLHHVECALREIP